MISYYFGSWEFRILKTTFQSFETQHQHRKNGVENTPFSGFYSIFLYGHWSIAKMHGYDHLHWYKNRDSHHLIGQSCMIAALVGSTNESFEEMLKQAGGKQPKQKGGANTGKSCVTKYFKELGLSAPEGFKGGRYTLPF